MKVVAINGSARKGGNTAIMLNIVMDELKSEGIETEMIELGGKALRGCIACYKCFENKDKQCAVKSDAMNEHLEKVFAADGLLLGSPSYYCNVSAEMKAFIDRCGLVQGANGGLLARKVGAAVSPARRAGAVETFQAMNRLFLYCQMFVPGSTYWNIGIGREKGEVTGDEEGIRTMENLGKNMAWLMKKVYA